MNGFWTNRRVLVTGGTGFLGQAVCRLLDSQEPTLLAVPASGDYDLRRSQDAAKLLQHTNPDTVIHLAAQVGGIGANQQRPADLYLNNLLMGTNIIEQCRLANTNRLVVVGTICSYPKHTAVPFTEDSLWDGYPEETNAPYGIAKLAHLTQLQANRSQYGQQGIYLMPTNLYGPGDKFHPAVSHVIPALIKKCVDAVENSHRSIVVWGTGTASREFLYVDDAARGILAATEHYMGAEPVNLGANREIAIKDLVEHIAQICGFNGQIEWDPTKPDGQPRRCVDASRAIELFGFEATTAFSDGLKRTYNWYMANRQQAEKLSK
ncbi:MAG: GDP-L-fucose synthase [bacterium]|nr:GDP-L-fucose synthase [bacterium]